MHIYFCVGNVKRFAYFEKYHVSYIIISYYYILYHCKSDTAMRQTALSGLYYERFLYYKAIGK